MLKIYVQMNAFLFSKHEKHLVKTIIIITEYRTIFFRAFIFFYFFNWIDFISRYNEIHREIKKI